MQKEFIKNIYKEFVYCDPNDHLLNPNNTLTRPETAIADKQLCCASMMPKLGERNSSKHMLNKVSPINNPQFVTINSETASEKPKLEVRITGDNTDYKIILGDEISNNSEITVVTSKLELEDVEIQKSPLNAEAKTIKTKSIKTHSPEPIIYDEETFNQIELRGFITKDLLRMSLDKASNLFHIAEDIFEKLVDRYNQFKEILHTLKTEFDNTVECIIETGKELGKKINHIIYQLYLAIMNKKL